VSAGYNRDAEWSEIVRAGRRMIHPPGTTLENTDALIEVIDRVFPTAKHAAIAAGTNEPTARNWKRKRSMPSIKHVMAMQRNSREFMAEYTGLVGYQQESLAMKLDADLQQTKARLTKLMQNWDEIKP
jgi:hypothetical protein